MLVRIAGVVVLTTALTLGATTLGTTSTLTDSSTGTTGTTTGTTSTTGTTGTTLVVEPADHSWCC